MRKMEKEKREDNNKIRENKKFSLPQAGMSFENEIAVLRAIFEFSNKGKKAIMYRDIKIPGVSPNRISSELNFFESIKLLNKGDKRGKYLPSKKLIEFINNLIWNRESEAKNILKEILLETWFGNLTKQLLNIKEISLDDLISQLGKESFADPKKDKRTIERLIEWLKYAEIIEVDKNNKVKLKEILEPIKNVKETPTEIIKEEKLNYKRRKEISINISFLIEINSQTNKEEIKKIIKTIKEAINETKIEF